MRTGIITSISLIQEVEMFFNGMATECENVINLCSSKVIKAVLETLERGRQGIGLYMANPDQNLAAP